jgi:type I restriction enzyme S subunit
MDFSDVNYLTAEQTRIENFLQPGDFLITRLSGSLEYVGNCAVVPSALSRAMQYPDRIFCAKLSTLVNQTYVSYCFEARPLRRRLEEAAKSTAGHQRISISDVLPFSFPLPPVDEQEEIVKSVEHRTSIASHIGTSLQRAFESASALRQSILEKAFRGELVPQDPNDEPASVLLERIRAERVAAADAVKPARSRKPRVKTGAANKP